MHFVIYKCYTYGTTPLMNEENFSGSYHL